MTVQKNQPESRMLRRQCLSLDRKTHREAACFEGRTYYGTETPSGKPHAAKAELITKREKTTGEPHAANAELITGQTHQPEGRMH
jgi:hypothetical protein